jgi:ribonuclease PH
MESLFMQRGSMFSRNSRAGKREYNQLRTLKVTYDVYTYSQGSILFEIGGTKILCSVTIQNSVPHFLRGKRKGWLTAEYSLLPASTPIRAVREVSANKRNGRTIEISRLIGRSLRAVSDLSVLGENTIFVDCDVMQADGGTRTACIVAAYMALKAAQQRLIIDGIIESSILTDEIASVSVGMGTYGPLLDMDFAEDSSIFADYNFIITRSGRIVEIQGTAEHAPITWSDFEDIKALALKGTNDIFAFYDENIYSIENLEKKSSQSYVPSYRDIIDYV